MQLYLILNLKNDLSIKSVNQRSFQKTKTIGINEIEILLLSWKFS